MDIEILDISASFPCSDETCNIIQLSPVTYTGEEIREISRWYGWSKPGEDAEVKCRLYILYSNGKLESEIVDNFYCD